MIFSHQDFLKGLYFVHVTHGPCDVCVFVPTPAGMQAFYEVKSCGGEAGSKVKGGVVRDYYLAAEKVLWNYAPSGKDLINNVSLTEADRWADTSSNYV